MNSELTLKHIIGSKTLIGANFSVITKLLDALYYDNLSISNIEDIVNLDQIVVSHCLKLCNSSFYGLPTKVNNLKDALLIIGIDNLTKIVLTVGIKRHFKNNDLLWKHSVHCAILSQILFDIFKEKKKLCKGLKEQNKLSIYTSALLHDIGKIVLDPFLDFNEFSIREVLDGTVKDTVYFEKKILGYSHTDVGILLAENLNLPYVTTNIISRHHEPILLDNNINELEIIKISNLFTKMFNFNNPSFVCLIDTNILNKLDITAMDMIRIQNNIKEEFVKVDELLSNY